MNTNTSFDATSTSNRNVAIVRINIHVSSENLRKLHEEIILMSVIDINHYNFK